MGDKSRQVPNPELVLMYRRGLSRARIADLVGVPASKVGYHLTVARSLDTELSKEHEASTLRKNGAAVSPRGIERMNDLIEFVSSQGRYPSYRGMSPEERTLSVWLQRRRRNAAAGTLARTFNEGLQSLPGWETKTRTVADESRWQERFSELAERHACHRCPNR